MKTFKLIIAMTLATSAAIFAGTYQETAQDRQREAEYSQRVATFNQASDYYLDNCLNSNTTSLECQPSLNIINDFLAYAKIYFSRDTLQKRIVIENTLRQRDISAREDLSPLEKMALTNCFSFQEDNHAQTDLRYKSTPECDQLIKQTGKAGSKDRSIAYEYSRIIKRELETARKARLLGMFNNLALPHDSSAYQETVSAFKKDFPLFKELLQELKYGSWIEYLQSSQYVPDNQVYGGLFKAIVCNEKLTGKDRIIKNELTGIVRYWIKKGKIPHEPSYNLHKNAGREKFHGFGVAWALLRDAAVETATKGMRLSLKEKAAIVDEILIRCGDRKERILLDERFNNRGCGTHCSTLIENHKELLESAGITLPK